MTWLMAQLLSNAKRRSKNRRFWNRIRGCRTWVVRSRRRSVHPVKVAQDHPLAGEAVRSASAIAANRFGDHGRQAGHGPRRVRPDAALLQRALVEGLPDRTGEQAQYVDSFPGCAEAAREV